MENIGGMKLGIRENPEKNPKNSNIAQTIILLAMGGSPGELSEELVR